AAIDRRAARAAPQRHAPEAEGLEEAAQAPAPSGHAFGQLPILVAVERQDDDLVDRVEVGRVAAVDRDRRALALLARLARGLAHGLDLVGDVAVGDAGQP